MKRRLMLLGLAALPLAAIAQQGPGILNSRFTYT